MAKYLQKQEGKAVTIGEEFSKHFDLIYYHKDQEDQKFMFGRERNDVIDAEIALCGYFVIVLNGKAKLL